MLTRNIVCVRRNSPSSRVEPPESTRMTVPFWLKPFLFKPLLLTRRGQVWSVVVVWFACARHGPFNHESFNRWSGEVGSSWTSQQDGFRCSVALVPKRRSGQWQRGQVRRHRSMAEVVAANFSGRRSSQTFWESMFEPRRGFECSASPGVPPRSGVGSLGKVRFDV